MGLNGLDVKKAGCQLVRVMSQAGHPDDKMAQHSLKQSYPGTLEYKQAQSG